MFQNPPLLHQPDDKTLILCALCALCGFRAFPIRPNPWRGKGERDRLGRTRRRLADGIRPPHGPAPGESVPHNAKVLGVHLPPPQLSFSPTHDPERSPRKRTEAPPKLPQRPQLRSAFRILPSPTPGQRFLHCCAIDTIIIWDIKRFSGKNKGSNRNSPRIGNRRSKRLLASQLQATLHSKTPDKQILTLASQIKR